jgi:hypothetical protein
MMNAGMKGMGLATPLALLYHHRIIVDYEITKIVDVIFYIYRDNNPAYLFTLYSLLVVPCISTYLYVSSSVCARLLCGTCRS